MTERYQFHFRHILKDGTVLKDGEKLPVTPASQAPLQRLHASSSKPANGKALAHARGKK